MKKVELEVNQRRLILETGVLARQAAGSVLVRYGDTVVLVCTVYNKDSLSEENFLPLTVDYREPTYAAGKIPGGFFKREGKPRDKEILVSRLMDRPLRPLFPKNYRIETQIVGSLLSSDLENEGDFLGIIGASTALLISEIPFTIPVGAVRVAKIDNNFIINPTLTEQDRSVMNLIVAGTKDSIVMIEGSAREISNDDFIYGLKIAHNEIKRIVELQEELAGAVGKPKLEIEEWYPKEFQETWGQIENIIKERIKELVIEANNIQEKQQHARAINEVINKAYEMVSAQFPNSRGIVAAIVDEIVREDVRRRILEQNLRLDGRSPSDIRPITCSIGILPRTHGSALFTRGQTQALAVTTLGTKSDEQIVDDLERQETKSFMLHYNFPGFSTGEVRPFKGPSRREIGHGALAERALEAVLPPEECFPYTIRVVSDILESNGSSSMATVCSASLSLMDAGVPIKRAVAGISIGLVKENDNYVLLNDIIGAEDHYGDMDFKVAGTTEGITAVQLDLKITGVPIEILKEALERATIVRREILNIMAKTIDAPRRSISQYAPRITAFKVRKDKIGDIIGPGGKVIRRIIDETGATIDIDNDGEVTISAPTDEQLQKARDMILEIVEEVQVGKIYTGTVKRIANFGAFVEILPGKEGLVHISHLAKHRIRNVSDVVKVGDVIRVKVIGIDDMGRINLSKRLAEQSNETPPYKTRR
ncbi:MAG: polyribonucleotide nucleotidyltransferase [candidate division WOR-3 bacterium]|nr:polyribonucleotide nucleotidyltransferase [candidate division WOR-3 bacterium]MDW7987115.1 polyribonucleotide nucleotidyltransferase [candidate division WOR-3 bacterium]